MFLQGQEYPTARKTKGVRVTLKRNPLDRECVEPDLQARSRENRSMMEGTKRALAPPFFRPRISPGQTFPWIHNFRRRHPAIKGLGYSG